MYSSNKALRERRIVGEVNNGFAHFFMKGRASRKPIGKLAASPNHDKGEVHVMAKVSVLAHMLSGR
jgi:hypothetical protein